MDTFASVLMAALVLLPAIAVATWTGLCMAQAEDDLRAFSELDSPSLDG
jgi:hypothetical protein